MNDSQHVFADNVAYLPFPDSQKGIAELPLPLTFAKDRFTYTQRWRSERAAVYSQRHPCGSVVYEAILIQHYPEHTWPNGTVTPAKEGYPGATAWGRAGWTFRTQPEAMAFLTERHYVKEAVV